VNTPTVYVDTNILSALHYRGVDSVALVRRRTTREWWKRERPFFRVFASRAVESELAAGEYPGKKQALAEVRRQPYLAPIPAVRRLTAELLLARIIPVSEPNDAVHLAFATVHGVDYLLSWNRAHLVNEETQAKLARFRARTGMRTPLVVSPDSIPKAALGESIRRRD
jgi:predicted nucleic acid-binding protein